MKDLKILNVVTQIGHVSGGESIVWRVEYV